MRESEVRVRRKRGDVRRQGRGEAWIKGIGGNDTKMAEGVMGNDGKERE